ncbi:BMC domain-containing protein [Vagococcus fluvialis]|uniref:Ethanolamine utilization protein similar to PduA/PduJ n=1 Tax=Vagococcus fluvialis bH819 TaxID=1255619 RepID=A0A1X6WPK4_9ENTE|nr:BMC domain-containing protein [Vagococcus sp.]SLM86209.1 Ethanolamine utilization protein similar to PduA/PduJ [Vagococcus fluvialis bH819]
MKIESLGLIEVKGFLGAIAAADAALKTADVALLNAEVIKGGQTTIQLAGDVAAVKVAVEAGSLSAESLNCLISSHVIPRMAEDTAKMVMASIEEKKQKNKVEKELVEAVVVEEVVLKEEPKVVTTTAKKIPKIDLKKSENTSKDTKTTKPKKK